MFQSINPATEAVIAQHAAPSAQDIDAHLDRLTSGQPDWLHAGYRGRGQVLEKCGALLRERASDLALEAAREMGKPVAQGRAEVEKCGWLCDYFAKHAEDLLENEPRRFDEAEVRLRCDPLGLVFSVTPWNYPYWQIMRAAVPALAAGNVVFNKPASNVIGCAKSLVEVLREAGVTDGVFVSEPLSNETADELIGDDRIAGVCLTGSERAGSAVASAAGKAVKKVVLELGGSDPLIVLEDADVEAAAKAAAQSRFKNAGQVCISAKRMIVEAPVYDAFVEAFVAAAAEYRPGDPEAEETTLGPMARGDLREQLVEQVRESETMGARLIVPGGALGGEGFYYAPTVATDVPRQSPMAQQETFGPAAAIFRAEDSEEAIAIANDTRFGLSANLWTGETSRADLLAPRIHAGGVFVNSTTASDPRVPFGGTRKSGYGRELGREGIREFVNLKTVWIARD